MRLLGEFLIFWEIVKVWGSSGRGQTGKSLWPLWAPLALEALSVLKPPKASFLDIRSNQRRLPAWLPFSAVPSPGGTAPLPPADHWFFHGQLLQFQTPVFSPPTFPFDRSASQNKNTGAYCKRNELSGAPSFQTQSLSMCWLYVFYLINIEPHVKEYTPHCIYVTL